MTNLRTRYAAFDDVDSALLLDGLRLLVEHADLTGAFGRLHLKGEAVYDPAARSVRARLDRLRLDGGGDPVGLAGPAQLTVSRESVSIPEMRFAGPNSAASFGVLHRDSVTEIDATFRDVEIRPLARIAVPWTRPSGRVSALRSSSTGCIP